MKLSGQVVLVTGAGRGIGRQIAISYAQAGAMVLVADINQSIAAETVHLIESEKLQAALLQLDVSVPEEISKVIHGIEDTYGRLDVLINNAGRSFWKSPYEITVEEWDAILNTNLRGAFLLARESAKLMREKSRGAIINIASTRAHMSEPDTEAYAASKGGLLSLTHALAVSLGPDGIRVNCISPGWIETGDYTALRDEDHLQHPAQRVGTPEDVARACLFLTDSSNDFITGTELIIDGGMTRKMIYYP
ncbi:glucose 1-dehydrogenase [Brevibacillus ginsengisoli]|uniref:glucose 1-dehydrogenase n=1 Tax=Brevibacillus ginsengisoli TaxID=363854 RepID=UPI003CF307C4